MVALRDGHRVALFFSGRRHAGENLAEVLAHRAEELPPLIQMCDALSRNQLGELQTIEANCLANARRRFADIYDRFPEVCRHLLGDLFMSLIYTCQLNEANLFDYLTELQQHAEVLAACPERWMSCNYRDELG